MAVYPHKPIKHVSGNLIFSKKFPTYKLACICVYVYTNKYASFVPSS